MFEKCRCKCRTADAVGFPSPGGFTVCKGSLISEDIAGSFDIASKWYYQLRNHLIATGIIQDRVFQQDYEFKSASAAGSVVLGRTSSGNKEWKPIEIEGGICDV